MTKSRFLSVKIFLFTVTVVYLSLFFASGINLKRADLGRHLANGRVLLGSDSFEIKSTLLRTNFYSYTSPDYPVINHHWGSGILFYLVHKMAGFNGISVFFIFINVLTFLIFLAIAHRQSNIFIAIPVSIFLMVLIAERKEVRPEAFSCLLVGFYLFMFVKYKAGELADRKLLILPALQIFWVNIHIYFILGILVCGVFLICEMLRAGSDRKKTKVLLLLFLSLCAASLISPFHIGSLLYPLKIFGNYGYKLAENQSVSFIENYGIYKPVFLVFKISLLYVILSFSILILKNRKAVQIEYAALILLFSVMGYSAIRNLSLFAYVALPVISLNTFEIIKSFDKRKARVLAVFCVLALIFLPVGIKRGIESISFLYKTNGFGPGLKKGNLEALNFIRKEGIKGPVFNNYDIGSYLIYGLFPEIRVFVDNRPEAYQKEFFTEMYVPMQENQKDWDKADLNIKFNSIIFSHRDMTPWGQNFLIKRIDDLRWVPVYTDDDTIIFLKNTKKNTKLINKHRLPRSNFKIIRS